MKGRIIATGASTPNIVTDEDYIRIIGKKARIASRVLSHHSRYCVLDFETCKASTTNMEMARKASENAINMAGIDRNSIDMIIFSSASPDYLLPPSFAILQEQLKINHCAGFDIRSGCSGFGTAIILADQCIKTGMIKRALIVGVDVSSTRFLPFLNNIKEIPLRALFGLMFFGDAAAAIIMEAVPDNSSSGIYYSEMSSTEPYVMNGSGAEVGGSVIPYPTEDIPMEKWPFYQNSISDVYLPKVLIETIHNVLNIQQLAVNNFNYFVMPIDSDDMKKKVQNAFQEITDNSIISVSEIGGGLLNAAVPLALHDAVIHNKFTGGDRIFVYAAENTKWQHAVLTMIW